MPPSICSPIQFSLPNSLPVLLTLHPNKPLISFAPRFAASFDLYGLGVHSNPRNPASAAPEPRSWFGPNGQYIKELPCPSCRGRGYAPCAECGIERSRADCSVCSGKGLVTCHQCSGDRVIWEESIDERPWEKARSTSPLRMKEDDEVDNLEIKLEEKKKSKRVYQSPPPEVGLKISRSLKSLNAKTGLFSKRMKIIHRDPALHAQRVAAIKKAKGSAEARKRTSEALKSFFSDPENRRKRSIAMKGVKFYCKNCGREGHRRHYCPEHKEGSIDRRFRCRVCGEKGHNRRTCEKSRLNSKLMSRIVQRRCRICGVKGHNRRSCSQSEMSNQNTGRQYPHRSNPRNVSSLNLINGDRMANEISRVRQHRCRICNEKGHNRRNCPKVDRKAKNLTRRRTYACKLCHGEGHYSKTCPNRNMNNLQNNVPGAVTQ